MPEPIAATPTATPAAVAPIPATPAAPARVRDSRLPEGVTLKNDYASDIDKYFDGPEGKPEAATPTPAIAPVAEPNAKVDPKPDGVAARLAAKGKPAVPVAPAAAAPVVPAADDPVAKAEAEMRAHNPKWKPSDGWNVVKAKLKAESERAAQLEKDLAEAKAKYTTPAVAGVSPQEIEELKKREQAASDRLMVMDLENHPTFKAQFVEPKNAEIGRATELLKVHGVQADVTALIAKPRAELGKAVAEILKDVPEFDRVEIAESIRKAHAIDQSARSALGNSKELAKAIQSKSVERQRAAFASRWAPVSAAIGEYIQPVESPVDATPERRAADEAYNSEIKSLRERAEQIALSPTSDEAVAESAIKAAAYDFHIGRVLPRVVAEYEEVVTLNRQLHAELTALKGRNPNHSIRASVPAGSDPVTDPAKMDHRQAAEHFFRQ